MKTKKLKYKPDYNFKLIGISSSDEGYKISWNLAKILNVEIIKSVDIQIMNPKFEDYQLFSVFENQEKHNNLDIKLVSNKGNMGYLVEELKNIDFFLIINEDEDSNLYDSIYKSLKEANNITAVFKLQAESLKSKENLLF